MNTNTLTHQLSDVALHENMLGHALRFTKNSDDAADLLQDVLLKAMQKPHYFDGVNLGGWLYTIMRNLFMTQYQIKKRTTDRHVELNHYAEELISTRTYCSPDADSNLATERLFGQVARLPPSYREVIESRMNGMRYKDIANTLGIPVGTVKNRIHVARQILFSFDDSKKDRPRVDGLRRAAAKRTFI